VPAARHLANELLLPELVAAVGGLLEDQPFGTGPHDIQLAVRPGRRHRALDGVAVIAASSGLVGNLEDRRETLAAVARAGEIDVALAIGILAAVDLETCPGDVDAVVELRLRRAIDDDPGFVLHRFDGIEMINDGHWIARFSSRPQGMNE